MMNIRVDEENRIVMGMGKVRIRKIQRFSSNWFWKNIGCFMLDPAFGLGGSRL